MKHEQRLVLNSTDITNLLIANGKLPENAEVQVVKSEDIDGADEDQPEVDDDAPIIVFWSDEIELDPEAIKAADAAKKAGGGTSATGTKKKGE